MEKARIVTDKQKLFINEYLVDFNATQAAIRAGYSEDSAGVIGFENLKKPEIDKAIKEHIALIDCNRDKIITDNISFWKEVMRNPGSSENAKLKASEYLGKYAAMFTEKREVEHTTIDEEGNKTGILSKIQAEYDKSSRSTD